MWEWLNRKRTGIDRFTMPSLRVLIVGVGMWVWVVYRNLDPNDQILIVARMGIVMGIIGILVPLAVTSYRKRAADRKDDPEELNG